MSTRRTPRADLSPHASEEDSDHDTPTVSPILVDHLADKFPVRLSPRLLGAARQDTITDQAELRGQQQVIDYLRQLTKREA